jgi:mannose-1-phosphate guanylyltransferase/phosphomannomutase
VDAEAVRAGGFKVVVDYAYGSASFVMPNVLAKLGAEVLAVNPYAATPGMTTVDRWQQAAYVGELVRASGAHVGAVFDPNGEHLTLIDDTGHVLSDNDALFALLTLVCSTSDKPRVALPVAVSRSLEEALDRWGAEVEWTKLSTAHLMEVASSGDITFAGGQDGGYIFPAFMPAYDAVATFVHLMAMLAQTGLRLSKVVSQAPRVHIEHESVVTPWEQKGMVMRTLVERTKDRELIMVDGVKILHEDGWALVLPDPEEPVTHVWAEGSTQREAKSRAQEYARRIRQLLR